MPRHSPKIRDAMGLMRIDYGARISRYSVDGRSERGDAAKSLSRHSPLEMQNSRLHAVVNAEGPIFTAIGFRRY